jgi:predicted AAA+ superfamily ATPase
MAITNQERVGKGLDLLKDGLAPFVERELKAQDAQGWLGIVRQSVPETQTRLFKDGAEPKWDAASTLAVMWNQWQTVFRKTLGQSERTLVSELRDVRNRWAHQEPFSSDDTDRALDSMARLLTAVSAPQADEVGQMKQELRRLVYDEQVRREKRKSGAQLIETSSVVGLPAWRDVVAPHPDVASGRYQQAEFAADLWQVHLGEGTDEYRKPGEFFRRTYLTESLRRLLVGAVQRLAGTGGDPVVQLQTNFGGGKTHSMLALYHLFSGAKPGDLAGVDSVMAEAGVKTLPKANRVVLVGNKLRPGNPSKKPDGTVVRTLWGELAWQLGGKKAFARIAADDEHATSPGDALRELFKEHGPCLILIDEWVAYARQLHDQSDLPGGGFETQFSFAQALTESAKLAGNCLLVISLPASDTQGSPHTQAEDVEVGGIRGREALERLRNVVGRLESSWRPATAEEGFEIVRRRLFEPLVGNEAFKMRDVTASAFAKLYDNQKAEFPPECRKDEYEPRIKVAYPIHPEVFDQLYGSWSTLVKFQRTRGVLRLMAAVIHCLWEKGDRSPLIMPSSVPIDDPRVQTELTRYLSDNWAPIIEKDVDGPGSLPLRIDGEQPNLGKHSATRRVARTIYLGSAPTAAAAHKGLEDRRIKLGCVMPGESPAVFGDALRRLAAAATYLYQDGPRYWYSTQPTVTKLAEDRAEQLKRDTDKVVREIEQRVRGDLKQTGDFRRVHPMPQSSQDVPDDLDVRLVVLGCDHPYSKEAGSAAETEARAILENRGNTPRLFRNTLVFLAADKARLQDLDEAVRRYLAWSSIIAEKVTLNLDPQQVAQAESQLKIVDGTVQARIPETYQWLLVPTQKKSPTEPIEMQAVRLSGQDALAVRASKKLRADESLIRSFGSSRLRMELDRVPLWRGHHVAVRQLVEDFARYVYLPRVASPEVLVGAMRDGVELLTWQKDGFAYAESYDEAVERYRGLRAARVVAIAEDSTGLLVMPDIAAKQLAEEAEAVSTDPAGQRIDGGVSGFGTPAGVDGERQELAAPAPPRRYHGSVQLDPARVGRDAGRIAEEVIVHLVSLVKADVRVTLEIEAKVPGGVPDQVVRTVTENGRTLKFTSQGFERE